MLWATAPAMAQSPIIVKSEQKIGKQVVTDVNQVEPPKGTTDPATMLESKDWKCGRQFTDGNGRVWQLVLGAPDSTMGPAIAGWIISLPENRQAFLTTDGRFYARVK